MDTLVLSAYGNEALNTSSQKLRAVKDIANDNRLKFLPKWCAEPAQALLTAPNPKPQLTGFPAAYQGSIFDLLIAITADGRPVEPNQ